MSNLDHALALAKEGFHVFPLLPREKTPLTKHGFKDATRDEGLIRNWWRTTPTANIGVATGAVSGIVVLDVDAGHGGNESLAGLVREFGPLPTGPAVKTGGGGAHYYFKHPGTKVGNRTNMRKGIDVRGDGGYVVVPTSVHPNGETYEWMPGRAPGEVELQPMPAFMAAKTKSSSVPPPPSSGMDLRERAQRYADALAPAVEGSRNDQAFRNAGNLLALESDNGQHLSIDEVFEVMRTWNARNAPPLDDAELRACVESAAVNGTPRPPKLPRGNRQKSERESAIREKGNQGNACVPLTDSGNAERLVRAYGTRMRWVAPWKRWFHWNDRFWTHAPVQALSYSKLVARSIYHEAADCESQVGRDDLAKWAKTSENAERRKAMVELSKAEEGVAITHGVLDQHPDLLNCTNGTLDLKTFELRPHNAADLITKMCPTAYKPNASGPRWIAFIERILPDVDAREFVQRFMGSCLTGDVGDQAMLFATGDGANGKSTFFNAIASVLGDGLAIKVSTDMLLIKSNRTHPTELADLFQVRLALGMETPKGRELDDTLIKELTGGDPIRARRMREDFWQFAPTHKLVVITNHMPPLTNADYALLRRILRAEFEVRIPPEERDPRLPEKLLKEREAILSWLVQGCREWRRIGLAPPDCIRVAGPEVAARVTPVSQFVEECLVRQPGARVGASVLFDTFSAWAELRGYPSVTQTEFGKAMANAGVQRKKSGNYVYLDIALKTDLGQSGRLGQFPALTVLDQPHEEVNADNRPNRPEPSQVRRPESDFRVVGECKEVG